MVTALILFSALNGSAGAEADFDGYWSVEVVAVEGRCRARTIMLEVRDGEVSFAGIGAKAEGEIASGGQLRARISRGENVVRAKGGLSGALGEGSWRSSKCSGDWTARRG